MKNRSLSSRLHRIIDGLRILRIWTLALLLIAASVAMIVTGRDGLIFGQSYAAILGLVGLALALLNLPSPEQMRIITAARRARDVFQSRNLYDIEG
jgi:hypothetical protein